MQTAKVGSRLVVKVWQNRGRKQRLGRTPIKCIKMKIKAYLKLKKTSPRGWAVRLVGNKKLWGVSGRQLSGGLRYTGEIPQFGHRRTRTYSSKNITSSFYYCPSPIHSLSKVMFGSVQRLLAGGGVKCHSITDYCKGYVRRGYACDSFSSLLLVASFSPALPGGPLISWVRMEHSTEPLNHPSGESA